MAQARVQHPFLLFFLALLISSVHTTRTSPVYAVRLNQQQEDSETSPVFSLPLYPYDSIINPQNLNCTSRAISILEGDIARAKYVNSRLLNPTFFNSNTDIHQSPLTHIRSGAYSTRVGVGQPPKEFNLLVDTGSAISWLKCYPCAGCSEKSNSVFHPAQSSTYHPLPCYSHQCHALAEKTCSGGGACTYHERHLDQSFSNGDFATEKLSFGSSGSVGSDVAIGCGREFRGVDNSSGVLGLGKSEVAFPSQIKAKSFSYCLAGADSDSSSTLDFNSAAPDDSVIVPLLTNPILEAPYYYVELTGITFGEDQVLIPPSVYEIGSDGSGGIIINSGSTLTFLDPQVYGRLLSAFVQNAIYLQLSLRSFPGYEICYYVPSATSASEVDGPPMSFQFSDGETTDPLGPENYLIRVDDSTFCFAFKPYTYGSYPVSILGNIQQTGMRITYDLDNMLIGFSADEC